MKMLRSNGVHQSAGFGIQSRVLRKVRRRQAARRKGSRLLVVETLEQRALLSASPTGEDEWVPVGDDATVITGDTLAYVSPDESGESGAGDAELLLEDSGPLIGLNTLRADARFAGITGDGYGGSGRLGVAIIDTGIDRDHPNLRYAGGYDFYYGDSIPEDYVGHGTHVAGIVGSTNTTYTGVAPGVNLYSLKVFPDGSGGAPFSAISNSRS